MQRSSLNSIATEIRRKGTAANISISIEVLQGYEKLVRDQAGGGCTSESNASELQGIDCATRVA